MTTRRVRKTYFPDVELSDLLSTHPEVACPGDCLNVIREHYANSDWHGVHLWAKAGLFLRPRNHFEEGCLHYYAGVACSHSGNFDRGAAHYEICRDLLKPTPALRCIAGDVYEAIADDAQLVGRDEDRAVEYWHQATSSYLAQGRLTRMIACQSKIIWSLVLRGQHAIARVELDTAKAIAARVPYSPLPSLVDIVEALYCYSTGEYSTACDLCSRVLEMVDLPDSHLADVYWIWASSARALGHVLETLEYAQLANKASLTGTVEQMERCQRLMNTLLADVAPDAILS